MSVFPNYKNSQIFPYWLLVLFMQIVLGGFLAQKIYSNISFQKQYPCYSGSFTNIAMNCFGSTFSPLNVSAHICPDQELASCSSHLSSEKTSTLLVSTQRWLVQFTECGEKSLLCTFVPVYTHLPDGCQFQKVTKKWASQTSMSDLLKEEFNFLITSPFRQNERGSERKRDRKRERRHLWANALKKKNRLFFQISCHSLVACCGLAGNPECISSKD